MEQQHWCMKAKALCSLLILLISSWSSRLNCTRVCCLSPLLNCNYSLVGLSECNVMFVFKHMTNYSLLGEKLTAEVFWTWRTPLYETPLCLCLINHSHVRDAVGSIFDGRGEWEKAVHTIADKLIQDSRLGPTLNFFLFSFFLNKK